MDLSTGHGPVKAAGPSSGVSLTDEIPAPWKITDTGGAFKITDPSIRFTDLAAADPPVPYHASCNAELVVPLSPDMAAKLKALF